MSETAGPARAGSIYDLGYRRYEGVRLGRGAAIRALAADSFRTTYGIGHGGPRLRRSSWASWRSCRPLSSSES